MENDKWPEKPALKSPFNHNKCKLAAEPSNKPPVSSPTIQQIANNMGTQEPITATDLESRCNQALSGMPDFPDIDPPKPGLTGKLSDQPQQEVSNRELNNLLKSGYRPLDKINGKWSETSEGSGKLIIE